jgi:hypothetical protein
MSRHCHVFDFEGEHLASFAGWDAAHEWARLQALMNGVPTPLEVEDRRRGVGCRVWADRCETTSLDGDPAEDGEPADGGGVHVRPDGRDLVGVCVGARGSSFTPPTQRPPA